MFSVAFSVFGRSISSICRRVCETVTYILLLFSLDFCMHLFWTLTYSTTCLVPFLLHRHKIYCKISCWCWRSKSETNNSRSIFSNWTDLMYMYMFKKQPCSTVSQHKFVWQRTYIWVDVVKWIAAEKKIKLSLAWNWSSIGAFSAYYSGAEPENSERGVRVPHTSPRMKTVLFRRYSIQHCGRIHDTQ